MRRPAALALVVLLLWPMNAPAGGPLAVGGTFGVSGQPFTWSTAAPVAYRTDGGNLGRLTNAQAIARVQAMFQVWQDVPTAAIAYTRAGQIAATTGFSDGDVTTATEYNAVETACNNGQQSPIIFDATGALFTSLGMPSGVIGFAGPCALNSSGRIVSGIAVLNGAFINNSSADGELTDDEFDAAFIHEFGHFSGLDHSQLILPCVGCTWETIPSLPTMYPFLMSATMKSLAADDVAWISRLYPESGFLTTYGTISGSVCFSDGLSGVQGANVIARRVDDPATPQNESEIIGVSVVSGYLFTSSLGQTVGGSNAAGSGFGGRSAGLVGRFDIPAPPGEYVVSVESISAGFVGGSGVGPLSPPIPLPGMAPEPVVITVTAGASTEADLVLLRTAPRFDPFEGPGQAIPTAAPGEDRR
jgi:hypothetical protein